MLVIGPGVGEWVAKRIGSAHDPETHVGIGWQTDRIVCGVLYEGYTRRSIRAHIACEGQMTKEFTRTIFDYPFNQLDVEKIIAPIYEGNVKAISLVERLGMKEETRLKDTHPSGDLIFYVMRREDCRWIRSKKNG